LEDGIKSIHPKEIESTLISLFEQEKKSNSIKASLFNLVIYTEGNGRDSYLKALTKSLIKKFPCRIIFIREYSNKKDLLNTCVSALKPDGQGDGFFCELIEFEISKNYKERISFLVTPHVIADLPVYLLFAKDPSLGDTPTTLNLDKIATRIIFDSECMEHMSNFASYIKSLHYEEKGIGDLNWARFSSWRKLLLKYYSNREKLKTLATATNITISYNSHANESFHHNKIQAIYMQGFLATKMNWEFNSIVCNQNSITVSYKSNDSFHHIHLTPCEPIQTLPPGRIVSLLIHNQEEKTSFIREKESLHLVKICYSTKDKCEMALLYPLEKEADGNSLTTEIYYRETSKDFLAVIELISTWKTGIIPL
jgi:glucose-6-phosphate dehydrogenase assembly protein OpcA